MNPTIEQTQPQPQEKVVFDSKQELKNRVEYLEHEIKLIDDLERQFPNPKAYDPFKQYRQEMTEKQKIQNELAELRKRLASMEDPSKDVPRERDAA